MAVTATQPTGDDWQRLFDENEQLRTALESSLDENGRLLEDRDRLLRRVTVLARELQMANSAYVRGSAPEAINEAAVEAQHSQTEEELRVAFEELQVLTEELEVANTSLHEMNAQLEARVARRTHDLARANAALVQSEAAFRTLIEGIPQLSWRSGAGGEWRWSSPQWSAYTGQAIEASLGQGWLLMLHADDRAAARDAWQQADAGEPLEFEARIYHVEEQRHRHFRTRALPLLADDGTVAEWLGTSTDIDDIVQLRERQTVLVGELQHRTRNLMAVVQAVTLRTIKGSTSLDDFRRCIDDRLQALARAQSLLSRRGNGKVTFDVLLREELSAHVELDDAGNGAQVTTQGPAGIPLRSTIVQTFALALHELATNATKYGALATPGGHLDVRWEIVSRDDGPARLQVAWRESGVTNMPNATAAPKGGGYGRELIERALPYQLGARTSYAFTPDGVHCTIELDVPSDEPSRENPR